MFRYVVFGYVLEFKTLFVPLYKYLQNKTTNINFLTPTQNHTRAFNLTKKSLFHKNNTGIARFD